MSDSPDGTPTDDREATGPKAIDLSELSREDLERTDFDRDEIIDKVRGNTFMKGLKIDSRGSQAMLRRDEWEDTPPNATSVRSSKPRDMEKLLEQDGFEVEDLHVVTTDRNGDLIVTVVHPGDPDSEPGEGHYGFPDVFGFPSEEGYIEVLMVGGYLDCEPDEAVETLSEWSVSVEAVV